MSKTILFILFSLFTTVTSRAQSFDVAVDQRVELMSIIFYLAGNEEYSRIPEAYKSRIDAQFAPYADHKMIRLAKEYRRLCHIGWNAPVSLALQLEITLKGKIGWIEGVQQDNIDSRWKPINYRKFFYKLNDFYRKSNFAEFYRDSQGLYDEAIARFTANLDRGPDPVWFDDYFGPGSSKSFTIVLGFCIGTHNYGVRSTQDTSDKQNLYSVIGSWEADSQGMPIYPRKNWRNYEMLLVHEFSHSYCNPLTLKYFEELMKFAPAYRKMSEELGFENKLGGGWSNILYEALVRACTMRYFAINDINPTSLIDLDKSQGVFFTKELSDCLVVYENNRDKYPTLESFMPEIVKFYGTYFAKYIAPE